MATFDTLAELRVEIDGYTLESLSKQVSAEMERRTTIVHLQGSGHEGRGEDVGYDPDEQVRFQQAGPVLALAGTRPLGEFCEYVEQLELFAPDERSWRFRVWALESAALDLALRQAERSLPEVLGREPQPMRYVASLRLGEPPTLAPVSLRLGLDPTLRFKLDATSSWTPEIIAGLVATGAVDSIDFKGKYKGTVVDQGADPVLYRRIAEAFPDAWLEDPDLDVPEAAAALADEHARITWDAPIHGIADIEALPFPPRMVNIKPSRIGLLRELCETYDHCAAHGIGAYGGGQTELGVGRGQAQYLAAIFHADAPNDLAPAAYNQIIPPAGLPRSPLSADFNSWGFRWP
jgi:L-alanine-DL-glutamate epimerase-like enolase superfamily enzyme